MKLVAYENFDEAESGFNRISMELVPEKVGLDLRILIHFGRHFRLPQA